jgi:hypothetical protein
MDLRISVFTDGKVYDLYIYPMGFGINQYSFGDDCFRLVYQRYGTVPIYYWIYDSIME